MILSAAKALIYRDLTRVMRNKLRIAGTLVRPLLWLVVIGTGYSSIVPTVGKYPYQTYLMPGLIGMVLLFGSVLCSLTMAIEKESGSIKLLLVAPFSRYWIIVLRIISSAMIAVVYALLFISIVLPFNLLPAQINYPLFCMSICMTSLLWAATGTIFAVLSRGMENFSLIVNLVIFPLFFLSGALYPLNDIPTYMRLVIELNPFSYCVDLIQHGMQMIPITHFSLEIDIGIILTLTIIISFVSCILFMKKSFEDY